MSLNTDNNAPYSQFVETGNHERDDSESPPVPSNLIADSPFFEHIYYSDPASKKCCFCKHQRFKWCNIHWKCCCWKCRLSVCMAAFLIFLLLALSFLLTVAYLGGYLFQPTPAKPACCDESTNSTQCASFDYSDWEYVLKQLTAESNDGMLAYDEFGSSENINSRFSHFIGNISALDVSSLNCSSQFAFYINVYNAFAIKMILDHKQKDGEFVDSIEDITQYWGLRSVWKMTAGNIGGVDYTLDNIEHDTLRRYWNDSRMHACIVYASVSAPNLNSDAYGYSVSRRWKQGKTLEEQLNDSMVTFVSDTSKGVKADGDTLWLNIIFAWYEPDFQPNVKDFIARFLTNKTKTAVLDTKHIKYFDYNWDLNAA